jgi:uncharacterized membrane protein YkvA (DUF1232 family)
MIGLVARLSADPRVPRRVKAMLGVTAVYLASPIDVIPDFIPVLGYLDDVVVVAVVLDGILNHVDRAIVQEHWPGAPETLERAAAMAARVSAWVPRRLKARVFGTRAGEAET